MAAARSGAGARPSQCATQAAPTPPMQPTGPGSAAPTPPMQPPGPGPEALAPPPFVRVAAGLFLGSARAVAGPEALARAGISLCINVSRQQPAPRGPGLAHLRVPVFDDPAEDLLGHLEPTCAAMEATVRAGGACLVYCKNGRSRSATVCTAYLMRHRGLSLARAFQLQKYEEALQSQGRLPRSPANSSESEMSSGVKPDGSA